MNPTIASPNCTNVMTSDMVIRPRGDRKRTTKMATNASERLRLAEYNALVCPSVASSAAIENPALVSALAIVTRAQAQKLRW
jgi:hypothetical protein